jgi:hypothetical protein
MVGVRLSRISGTDEASLEGDVLSALIEQIATIDPKATLLPHNKSIDRAVKITSLQNIPASGVRSFFDVQVVMG